MSHEIADQCAAPREDRDAEFPEWCEFVIQEPDTARDIDKQWLDLNDCEAMEIVEKHGSPELMKSLRTYRAEGVQGWMEERP